MEDKQVYSVLSKIYPYLMKQVNYKSWAKYISAIYELYNNGRSRVMEVASGNSKIHKYFKDDFEFYLFSDRSLEMLKTIEAEDKKAVCFDMRAIPLKGEFDFIFSIFDSVNYLMEVEDLRKFFNECRRLLSPEGILTFDVTLVNNSLRNLKLLNRKGKYKGIKFEQISRFDPVKQIHQNVFEIIADGEVYREVHKQRIYDFETYFEVLEDCGYAVSACFDCFTFDDADDESERVQFVVRTL